MNGLFFNYTHFPIPALSINDESPSLMGLDKAVANGLWDDWASLVWQPLKPACARIISISIWGRNCSYKGNNVCQESVKLEPKPTLLFKSTPQVPTSSLMAKLTMSNTNKPANSIRSAVLTDSLKRDFVHRFPYNSMQNSSSWKSGLYSEASMDERGNLLLSLLAKDPDLRQEMCD